MFSRRSLDLILALVLAILPVALVDVRLLTRAEPWFAFAAGATLLRTQPPVGPRRMIADRGDRLSAAAIFAGVIACFQAGLLEFAWRASSGANGSIGPLLSGMALVAIGLGIRVWAIRTLGRWFTPTVEVAEEQPIVEAGPYARLRHPSYTGTVVALVGLCVLLGSPAGGAVAIAIVLPAYLYRIAVEERALSAHFGERYAAYRRRTWGLVPPLR